MELLVNGKAIARTRSSPLTTSTRSVSAAHQRAGVLDQAAYWLTLAGVYLLVGVLFLYSGKGKLFDDNGHAPAALKRQLEGTFIDTIPGVDGAWVIIGVLELAVFA